MKNGREIGQSGKETVGASVASIDFAELRDLLEANKQQPEFEFRVGWSSTYDNIFRGEGLEITSTDELLSRAISTGRLLLTGAGGSGKTVILRKIAQRALDKGMAPLLLDLRAWTLEDYAKWLKTSTEDFARMEFLLQNLAVPHVDIGRLSHLSEEIQRVLLIDGLNEVVSGIGDEIIRAADDYIRYSLKTSLVITDRLVRRQLSTSSRWLLARVEPLDTPQIRKLVQGENKQVTDDEIALFTLPFYLDAYLKEDSLNLHSYFTDIVKLSGEELASSSRAAFDAYSADKTRSFSSDRFAADVGSTAYKKLKDAGVIRVGDSGTGYFRHHLLHDYLASLYVSADQERWTGKVFDIVSFRASSFDAIAMVLQQLTEPSAADHFVRQLYDWNPYASVYSLAEATHRKSCAVTEQMTVVVLAMIAERKWDLIEATAIRARDALALYGSPFSNELLKAPSLDYVFTQIHASDNDPEWFIDWRLLFTRPKGSHLGDADVDLIAVKNSIEGWTAANVFKRLTLSDKQMARIREFLSYKFDTVRWRAAHVLGTMPSSLNMSVLLKAIDVDESSWVRFGAARSLIEMAALGPADLREAIFKELIYRVPQLLKDEIVLGELKRSLMIDQNRAPADWANVSIRFVEEVYESGLTDELRDEWAHIAYQLKDNYGLGHKRR
jgi:hypothetical protein